MRYNRFKLLICITLVTLAILGFASTALAAPQLEWHTTDVFYDDSGHLIIKGYVYNSGTYTIDKVNFLHLYVYFRQYGTDWWLAASGRWNDFDVYLEPGDTARYRLEIRHPYHYKADQWFVKGDVNYHIVN